MCLGPAVPKPLLDNLVTVPGSHLHVKSMRLIGVGGDRGSHPISIPAEAVVLESLDKDKDKYFMHVSI